ncbi:hypothetical protein KY362_00820 [Candidatus Woesearchaeota archaeon]|nr:hypothetical protein [Candidatus Woesearchaeota archaeon]
MSSIDTKFAGAESSVRRAAHIEIGLQGSRRYAFVEDALVPYEDRHVDRLVQECAQEILDAHNTGVHVSRATYEMLVTARDAMAGTGYEGKLAMLVSNAEHVGISSVPDSEGSSATLPYMMSPEEFRAEESTPLPEKRINSSPRLRRAPAGGKIETKVGDGYSSTAITKPTPVPGRVNGDGTSSTYRGPNPLDTPPPQPVDDQDGIYMLPESDYVLEDEVRDADGDAGSCIRQNPLRGCNKGRIPPDTVPDMVPKPVAVYASAASTAPEIPSVRTAYSKQ